MISLSKTSRAFLTASKLKQAIGNQDVQDAVDALLNALGANAIVITDNTDPADAIVIGDNTDPSAIAIPDDVDPVEAILNAAIEELNGIAQNQDSDSIKSACQNLTGKLSAVIDAIDSL